MRDTASQGQDFSVFWRAARAWISGDSIYDLKRDGAMVFKYPPWILPVFLPLAFLPLMAAKWIWGGLQIAAMLLLVRYLILSGIQATSVFVGLALFWVIWAVHAMDGQISVWMLVFCLGAPGWLRLFALSTKTFSLVAAFGIKKDCAWKDIGIFLAICGGLFAIVCAFPHAKNPSAVFSQWLAAANSGAEQFQFEKIHGRDNQGIPALVERNLEGNATAQYDLIIAGICFLGIALVYALASTNLGSRERYFGWLAIVPVVHPLAWVHLFTFAFPLAALMIDQARGFKSQALKGVVALGVVCVALVSRGSVGDLGEWLECLSIRSWGVLILIGAMIVSKRAEIQLK